MTPHGIFSHTKAYSEPLSEVPSTTNENGGETIAYAPSTPPLPLE